MKKKNWIVIALCVAIVGMGIGFAALAQNLQISATANITGEWDVRIVDVSTTCGGGIGDGVFVAPPSFDGTSATFEVDLPHPGAYATFCMLLGNYGNIPARLNSITGITAANSSAPSEIQVSVGIRGWNGNFRTVDITENTIISIPGGAVSHPVGNSDMTTDHVIYVRVEWIVEDGIESVIPDVTTKTATINLNYVQHT